MFPSLNSLQMASRSFEVKNSSEGVSLSDSWLTRCPVWHEVSQILHCTLANVLESICSPLLPLSPDFFVEKSS